MKRLIGGILLAAGVLIGGASGLCSTVFLMVSLFSTPTGLLVTLPMVAMFGGPPMLIGFGLYKWGRWLIRQTEGAGHGEFD